MNFVINIYTKITNIVKCLLCLNVLKRKRRDYIIHACRVIYRRRLKILKSRETGEEIHTKYDMQKLHFYFFCCFRIPFTAR